MNEAQSLWWQQAKSDHEVFELLRGEGVPACHSLHYLQMATEKLAKASFWANNDPPAMRHVGFAQFLRRFGNTPRRHRNRIALLFGFGQFSGFQTWIRSAIPLARQIDQVSPAVIRDGPNSEYPWPHDAPIACPAQYHFAVWDELKKSQGRKLMRFTSTAIKRFPDYASGG
ncbi:hypothetical protein CA51_38470 [Rosistilla oblonga]|nr:hypothetical protein CA51_38470 [Rosistilla oblonga]